jgi:hypothetical protein
LYDVLLIFSTTDHAFGTKLENIFTSLFLSVWKYELDGVPSPAVDEAICKISLAKTVVIVLSKRSCNNNTITTLAAEALKQNKLLPVSGSTSYRLPTVFEDVQIQRVKDLSEWDSNPDDGLYKFLCRLRDATQQDFRLEPSLEEHNKQVGGIYVKADGQAYMYYGATTTAWLSSEAFQRQREEERKKEAEEKAEITNRHFVPEATKTINRNRQRSSGFLKNRSKLFISYSRTNGDAADRLDSIFRALRLPIWWDECLTPGSDGNKVLRRI